MWETGHSDGQDRLPVGRYVKIVANVVGLVGSLDKAKIKDAREANFNLYRE